MSSIPDDEEPVLSPLMYIGLSSMTGMYGVPGAALNASDQLSKAVQDDEAEEEPELGPEDWEFLNFVCRALDHLLADYVKSVHEPEMKISYRRAVLQLKDRSHLSETPELWDSIDIVALRQEFAERWLNDKTIGGIKVLFESGGLIWDRDLEVRGLKHAKRTCTVADAGVYEHLEPRLLAFEKGIRQWAIDTQDVELSDPKSFHWNLDRRIAGVLDNGQATASMLESEFSAMNRAIHYSETIRLLDEIASCDSWTPRGALEILGRRLTDYRKDK